MWGVMWTALLASTTKLCMWWLLFVKMGLCGNFFFYSFFFEQASVAEAEWINWVDLR